jgi:hypothetical protein
MLFNPWGLLGLLAIPAILAIHLFRRRFHPRPVTGLFLYGPAVRTVSAGRTRQRLLWRASLLAELAAALAFTWYLCDPHWDGRQDSRHLVVVLDSRWRVAAETPAGSTDAALRGALGQRLAALDSGDRVTLVASGVFPKVLCGPAARPPEALGVLEAWVPDQPWHQLDSALTLGRSLADAGATVLVASDHPPAGLPPAVGVLALGQARPTSGVVDARWYEDADGRRVVARVLAQGAAITRRLELRHGDGLIAAADLRLADGVAESVSFPVPMEAGDRLHLVLAGADPLPADDLVTLIRPPPTMVRVRMDLPMEHAVVVRRALAVLSDARVVEDALEPVHLVIGGNDHPPAGTWAMRIEAGKASPVLGPFLSRRGHPLLGGIDFTGVLWTGGLPAAELSGEATPLVEAGAAVLISEQRRGRDRLMTLHLDPAGAGVADHPAWPALIANLVAARRAMLPGCRQPNLLAGQDALAVLPPGRTSATLISPDGHEARVNADGDGTVLIPGLTRFGIHRLLLDDVAGDWLRLNVMPCDARMADLGGAATLVREPQARGTSAVERDRPMLAHLLPIIAAALAALGGWWAFGREEAGAP